MSARKVVRQKGFWPPAKCPDCGSVLDFYKGEYSCSSRNCNPPLKPPKKKAVKKHVKAK